MCFENCPDRRDTESVKWGVTIEGVIPMWVADMDFAAPPPIVDVLYRRINHPVFGYPMGEEELKKPIVAHYEKLYHVQVQPEWIVWVASVMPGTVTALKAAGGTFLYSIPMYNHIRELSKEAKLPAIEVPMKRGEHNYFTFDMEAMENAYTADVKSVILCSPHNPVGRVFTQQELEELAAFCERHDLLLISDEIHCELTLEGRHIPAFSINEWALGHSVTLSSAGKVCNIPGLPLGFAIIPDPEIRERFRAVQDGTIGCFNVLTMAAYEKAYDGSCDAWKDALRDHLRENRDYLEEVIAEIPQLTMTHNEGTYLSWIDCSALGLENPAEYFLKEAKVMFSDGAIYGAPQCIRLNFGCPKAQLKEALRRMKEAVEKLL
ncbi:MAG: aminotransferase class I/II-fold pyridoxal phosphate-dependent enzyme [Blautia sp.]|nr:aminotransferase class I/II-fold pyridoxal phosphate-dependent enzyme [Blautia sp.]